MVAPGLNAVLVKIEEMVATLNSAFSQSHGGTFLSKILQVLNFSCVDELLLKLP